MKFPQPLVRGRLVQRYKRFFADVVLDSGEAVTAHCPNPGAMLGLNQPGLGVWLSRSDDPKRKLAHTLELVEADGCLVGVNTMNPNKLVAEALADGVIPEVTGYESIRREVKYGVNSRVDFLLESPGERRLWLEVKNCHFSRQSGLAEFPDCVAARSAKHLGELEAMVADGDRAAVLFVVQREDCHTFSVCRDLDPTFAAALERVADAGVEVLIYQCVMTPDEIRVDRPIEWARSRKLNRKLASSRSECTVGVGRSEAVGAACTRPLSGA